MCPTLDQHQNRPISPCYPSFRPSPSHDLPERPFQAAGQHGLTLRHDLPDRRKLEKVGESADCSPKSWEIELSPRRMAPSYSNTCSDPLCCKQLNMGIYDGRLECIDQGSSGSSRGRSDPYCLCVKRHGMLVMLVDFWRFEPVLARKIHIIYISQNNFRTVRYK